MNRPSFQRTYRPIFLPRGFTRKALHAQGIVVPADGNICMAVYTLQQCLKRGCNVRGALITPELFAAVNSCTSADPEARAKFLKLRNYAKACQMNLRVQQGSSDGVLFHYISA